MSKGKIFREAMKRGMVTAPGCFDCITARSIERAGFEAVYMTGAGTAATLGYPDYGLVTMSEMADNAGRIATAIKLPVIADADTGYGNESNIARTVALYERAGVAALHIEDQDWPKRCGFLEGKRVIPADEMVLKVRAAVAARTDPGLVLIARTDALQPNGWDDAVARAKRYREAGADMVFMDGLKTRDLVERAARDLAGIPQLLNSWLVTPAEARAMGFALYIHLGVMFRHFSDIRRSLEELRDTGTLAVPDEDLGVERITRVLQRHDA